ncbi:MAG: hypothetical protein KIT81_13905 [Alphaproteobacteria bacterium]|nr:hypothetical protein [Alphaproteobacteria bacterium]
MEHSYTYRGILKASERSNWRIEDLVGGDKRLDFTKRFLPETLAGVERLGFLTPDERRVLNQIRGNGYLCMFGLVEEFILPFVMDHARPFLAEDDYRTRALLRFACEEAKHIHLFKLFRQEFEAGFGTDCEVIGPPQAIAAEVLKHDPLSVAIAILHIEWMTQRHYLESVKDDHELDDQFKSLLRNHWMEEAQHAKLDTLMVLALAEGRSPDGIDRAIEGYLEIGGFLDAGLAGQVELDIAAFERATGRKLDAEAKAAFSEIQLRAQRWTFLGSGMSHPNLFSTLERILPGAGTRVAEIARAFS